MYFDEADTELPPRIASDPRNGGEASQPNAIARFDQPWSVPPKPMRPLAPGS